MWYHGQQICRIDILCFSSLNLRHLASQLFMHFPWIPCNQVTLYLEKSWVTDTLYTHCSQETRAMLTLECNRRAWRGAILGLSLSLNTTSLPFDPYSTIGLRRQMCYRGFFHYYGKISQDYIKKKLHSADRASCNDSWQMTNVMHKFFSIFYKSLHVSSKQCSSSGETNCINTVSSNSHSMLWPRCVQVSNLHTSRPPKEFVHHDGHLPRIIKKICLTIYIWDFLTYLKTLLRSEVLTIHRTPDQRIQICVWWHHAYLDITGISYIRYFTKHNFPDGRLKNRKSSHYSYNKYIFA
jgi:hypothetical protein